MKESPQQIEKRLKIREKIINTLQRVKRSGIDKLIEYLDKNGFFISPASSFFHLTYPGGLAEHSWNAYETLLELVNRYKISAEEDSIIIDGLCHDICKINAYKPGQKRVKQPDGEWITIEGYEKDDSFFPVGHGDKSVIMLQNFIKLTQEEILAIYYHMGPWGAGIIGNQGSMNNFYNQARKKTKMVIALHIADMIASHIVEL